MGGKKWGLHKKDWGGVQDHPKSKNLLMYVYTAIPYELYQEKIRAFH
jgi:hypothetical protein